FCRSLVIARGGIVVKTVVDVGIDIDLVFFFILFEGGFISWPTVIDARVETGILNEQRGMYLRDLVQRWLGAIEWDSCGEIGEFFGHQIDDTAAETKSNYSYFAITIGLFSQVFEGVDEVLEHFILVSFSLHLATLIVIPGVAA